MSLKIYKIQDYEHTHENEQFRILCEMLKKRFDKEENQYLLFANISFDSVPLDALFIKHNSIIILEFKNYGGRVKACENGDWKLADGTIIKGGSGENPFVQTRSNKFSLIDVFNSWFAKPYVELGHTAGVVVFNQHVEIDDSQIPQKAKSWFYITDMEHIVEKLEDIRSKKINYKNSDLNDLPVKLNCEDKLIYDSNDHNPINKRTKRDVVELITHISGDVKEIFYNNGRYHGSLNNDGIPDGVGTFIQFGREFTGIFHNGKPDEESTFEIKYQDDSCVYTGTVKVVNNEIIPNQGILYDSEKDKRYVGTFDGWLISEGKYYKGDRLVYEGSFSAVALKDGGKSLWYKYGTMYFDDHSFSGYFKDNQPFGEGKVIPIDNRIHVSIVNSHLDIELLIDGQSCYRLKKNSDRLPFPLGKRVSLKVNGVDEHLKTLLEECSFEIPQKKTNDYLDWDIDNLYTTILSQRTLMVDDIILNDGIHDGWHYSGLVNALMIPNGEGILKNDRGVHFKGNFKDGKREGRFEIIDMEGKTFFEIFVNDKY